MTISTTTLKNAAFAIEHDLFTDPDGANYLVKDGAILRRWEPAESDADAFSLMVQLQINVQFPNDRFPGDWVEGVVMHGECVQSNKAYCYYADANQAVRELIIDCAAKIGERE